jgi:HAD superfamily hydrolase (TIGR01484 family)
MSAIKLVVTDIDGTLVRERTHEATPAVHRAMQDVQAAGITVAAATARPLEMAQELFQKIGFKGPCIFDGGASVREVQTGELLWSNWLSVERMRAIAEITAPHATEVDYYPGFAHLMIKDFDMASIVEPAPYAWCMVRLDRLPKIIEQLEALGDLNVHLMNPVTDGIEHIDIQVTDINSDKFHGVSALQKLLDVTRAETLAIGDGSNDVPLFKTADTRVAMGNAIPELKAQATHQVASVEDDGWAEAMRILVLG